MKEYIITDIRLDKSDLQHLKVAQCPNCNHLTLQAMTQADRRWVCLTCGKFLELKYIAEE